MPTILSHAVVAAGLAAVVLPARTSGWIWTAGAVCAMAPDLDVVAFRLGIPYEDMLGHRGLSHSLAFAGVLGVILAGALRWLRADSISFTRLVLFLALATASHGLLDAITDGGLGVAFFAPFDDTRYFFPWRPVQVSPIGVRRFLSGRGLEVLTSELLWLWLPAIALGALAVAARAVARHPRGN